MTQARTLADFVSGTTTISGNPTFSGTVSGAGKLLQIVSHTETDFTTFSDSGTTRTDVLLLASNAADSTSHVSASITPSATSNKILIQVCVFYEHTSSEQEVLWDIYRDSTKLGLSLIHI